MTGFIDCPEYMTADGEYRCGLPAAIIWRYTVQSSDGPVECVRTTCPRGHHMNGPAESMAVPELEEGAA